MTYEQMTWTCETCGERIVGVEQGWVEWLYAAPGRKVEEGEPAAKGMRLVHARPYSPLKLSRTGCQYDEMAEYEASGYSLSSLELAHLMGPDGLMRLLFYIEEGEIPTGEVVELIKRLHIPGYEQARPHLEEGIAAGEVRPSIFPGVDDQEQIEQALRYAEIKLKDGRL